MIKSKRYCLCQRGNSGIYYAQIRDPNTRKLFTARSTRSHNKDEAETIAMRWLVNGYDETSIVRSKDALAAILKHWKPVFGDKRLDEITHDDLNEFGLDLYKSRVVPIPSR